MPNDIVKKQTQENYRCFCFENWAQGCPGYFIPISKGNKIALMMEAARTSETLVNFYQTTRHYNPEDSHFRTRCCENLKSKLGCCPHQ
jgi:hypothetical protein